LLTRLLAPVNINSVRGEASFNEYTSLFDRQRNQFFLLGEGRTAVTLRLLAQGRDILVLITGGAAHVGAVAVCDGTAELGHARSGSGMVQVPGHREGPLAAEASETLALAAGRTCVAVVGIHQDNATAEEIHDIVEHVRQGLQQLTTNLAEWN
jgi:hypothetical protein